MKVTIELAVVAKQQRMPIGAIEMEINLKSAVEIMQEQGLDLTHRETQVRDLMLKGLVHKEIAAELHLAERTSKFHAKKIYKKYGVRDRAALIYKLARAKKVVD